MTVGDAIGDITIFPEVEAGAKDQTTFIHSASRLTAINLDRIRNTSHNGGSRKEWSGNQLLQLKCYEGHDGHGDVYGRMAWEKASPTITTKFNSISNGRYGHPNQDRAISLREGAVLQSFPITYNFYSDVIGNVARMIGNAVPPKMAQSIGDAIIKTRINATI